MRLISFTLRLIHLLLTSAACHPTAEALSFAQNAWIEACPSRCSSAPASSPGSAWTSAGESPDRWPCCGCSRCSPRCRATSTWGASRHSRARHRFSSSRSEWAAFPLSKSRRGCGCTSQRCSWGSWWTSSTGRSCCRWPSLRSVYRRF